MATFGTFTLIKNENMFLKQHLFSWLPFVDQMVFLDGNSTDGTLEVLKEIQKAHPFGHRITIVENRDPVDLKDDYTSIQDEALHTLKTDYSMFCHPDMILDQPGKIGELGQYHAYFTHMRSFAGDPQGQLYEIVDGRAKRWKNIMRLRNPDLGLHYFGHYGAMNEDCYFSEITGDSHVYHGEEFERYPYAVGDSEMRILHFSDVRTRDRRIQRMERCLINQGHTPESARKIAPDHPRVNFKDGYNFKFLKNSYGALGLEPINA